MTGYTRLNKTGHSYTVIIYIKNSTLCFSELNTKEVADNLLQTLLTLSEDRVRERHELHKKNNVEVKLQKNIKQNPPEVDSMLTFSQWQLYRSLEAWNYQNLRSLEAQFGADVKRDLTLLLDKGVIKRESNTYYVKINH